MRELDRSDLLALTPDRYLAAGWTGADGLPKPELAAEFATAAATQLLEGQLAVQELAYTVAALEQLLPAQEPGPAGTRLAGALAEAIEAVGHMIGQTNNEGLVEWLISCALAVTGEAELDAFTVHLRAVLRLYAVLASLPAPDDPALSSSPSEPS